MFRFHHQKLLAPSSNSWISALKFISSSNKSNEINSKSNVIFNNLLQIYLQSRNSLLLQRLMQFDHSLNRDGLRTSLTILEKWKTKDCFTFAFWICERFPLLITMNNNSQKSEQDKNSNASSATSFSASSVCKLVDFFIINKFDFSSLDSEKNNNSFLLLCKLFARARALGIVETDPFLVGLFLKLSLIHRSMKTEEEATRLFSTIPDRSKSTDLFHDYSKLILMMKKNSNNTFGDPPGIKKILERISPKAKIVILDTNTLLMIVLKDEAIRNVFKRRTNDDDEIYQCLFTNERKRQHSSSSSFMFVVISHVVYQEAVGWLKRKENSAVKLYFENEEKVVNVSVPSHARTTTETLERLRREENWIWLSSEESVVGVDSSSSCVVEKSINDKNDHEVLVLANLVSQKVKANVEVVVATRDKNLAAKLKKSEVKVKVWP
jgi:hypothetical protein